MWSPQNQKNEQKKQSEADKLEEINAKIQKKLESYQELYDSNQRLIYLGQKVNDLAEGYFNNKRKRELMAELLPFLKYLPQAVGDKPPFCCKSCWACRSMFLIMSKPPFDRLRVTWLWIAELLSSE